MSENATGEYLLFLTPSNVLMPRSRTEKGESFKLMQQQGTYSYVRLQHSCGSTMYADCPLAFSVDFEFGKLTLGNRSYIHWEAARCWPFTV